jgi:hypothetical protein
MPQSPDSPLSLRRTAYGLLILAALGTMLGRLATLHSPLGKTPLLSANDRSRWATIRALVDHGTYQIDDVVFRDAEHTKRDREWYSIDVVRHKGRDGREHYYSSKPPLLATLLAGPYWLLQQLTGATLAERPFFVVRCLLILTNIVPLGIYFLLIVRLIERHGTSDWGRLFVATATCFGTFLTTFAVTLNNHVIAAVSAAIALYWALPIWREEDRRWRGFVVAGFFAAFTAANELPALSFAVALGGALLWRAPQRTLLAFVPAAGVVAVAALVTNYLAHGTWDPPYAHRRTGPLVATVRGPFDPGQLDAGNIPDALRRQLARTPQALSPQAVLTPRPVTDGWMLWDPERENRLALVPRNGDLEVRAWDDWYEFPGSYWASESRAGVDLGEPSPLVYAVHVLVGHHGVFSLTPIWLLSAVGLGLCLRRPADRMRGFAALVLTLTLVCLTFYLARPLQDRNYGGVTCGLRWLFWFAPLWLVAMVPAADRIAAFRGWRWVALALLGVSIFSASYAGLNPWSHPWLYQYWFSLGWVG